MSCSQQRLNPLPILARTLQTCGLDQQASVRGVGEEEWRGQGKGAGGEKRDTQLEMYALTAPPDGGAGGLHTDGPRGPGVVSADPRNRRDAMDSWGRGRAPSNTSRPPQARMKPMNGGDQRFGYCQWQDGERGGGVGRGEAKKQNGFNTHARTTLQRSACTLQSGPFPSRLRAHTATRGHHGSATLTRAGMKLHDIGTHEHATCNCESQPPRTGRDKNSG